MPGFRWGFDFQRARMENRAMSTVNTKAGQHLLDYLTSNIEGIAADPGPDWAGQWAASIATIEREAAKAERDGLRWEISNGPFITSRGKVRNGGVGYMEVMHVFNLRDELEAAAQ